MQTRRTYTPIKISSNPQHSTKKGWYTIGCRRIFFKSGWEVKYARYLEGLKTLKVIKDWEYEPQRFLFEEIKSGTRTYTPDFKVFNVDDTHYWVEVKGYMDAKSKTKIKRFRKYFPTEELRVIEKDWFIRG